MNKYQYLVTVEADTQDQADRVIAERLFHDEDYGFDYEIAWEGPFTILEGVTTTGLHWSLGGPFGS